MSGTVTAHIHILSTFPLKVNRSVYYLWVNPGLEQATLFVFRGKKKDHQRLVNISLGWIHIGRRGRNRTHIGNHDNDRSCPPAKIATGTQDPLDRVDFLMVQLPRLTHIPDG